MEKRAEKWEALIGFNHQKRVSNIITIHKVNCAVNSVPNAEGVDPKRFLLRFAIINLSALGLLACLQTYE